MLRGALIVLLFCWSGWAALAEVLPASPHDSIVAAAGEGCPASGDPRNTSDSEQRWETSSQITVSLTESLWKSSAVHAELSSARCAIGFVDADRAGPPRRPMPDASAHLLRIPLLI